MGKPFDPRDAFFRRAKTEGYRARSAFKLTEILGRQPLVRKGAKVIDLGAAPGAFLQVLAEEVGSRGAVVGVDLRPIEPLPEKWVTTLQADVEDQGLAGRLLLLHEQYDVVISDMAPATSGSASTDVARSLRLVERAIEVASQVLRPGGGFVAKVFMGEGFDSLVERSRGMFGKVKVVRPKATRSRSRECFLVCTGYRSSSRLSDPA